MKRYIIKVTKIINKLKTYLEKQSILAKHPNEVSIDIEVLSESNLSTNPRF